MVEAFSFSNTTASDCADYYGVGDGAVADACTWLLSDVDDIIVDANSCFYTLGSAQTKEIAGLV